MLDKLNVLQLGWQSTFGTANGTATRKLQNVSSFKLRPELETRALDQLRGTMAPTHQTVLDHYASSATFESADTTFEEINYFLEMLFGTDASVQAQPRLMCVIMPRRPQHSRPHTLRPCNSGNRALSTRCRTPQ